MTTFKLSQEHESQIKTFIKTVFDVRLNLALKDKAFIALSFRDQNKRAQIWLKHYAGIAYRQLKFPPLYDLGFPVIIKIFADESEYYHKFQYPFKLPIIPPEPTQEELFI